MLRTDAFKPITCWFCYWQLGWAHSLKVFNLAMFVFLEFIAFQEIYGFPKHTRQLTFALEAGAGRKGCE